MKIEELLLYIDPSKLTYQEWVNVGMALKDEGCSPSVWDEWSRKDSRYHAGECEKKWQSFNGNAEPVTAGTIYHYAVEQGYSPRTFDRDAVFDWDDEICYEGDNIVDTKSLEIQTFGEPSEWHPGKELTRYLETLFEANDNVGFVTEVWETEGKFMPTKGTCSRTAGELIAELNKYGDDIGAVIGDTNPQAGAWIRFNPLDGKGVKNDNVTEFRYALIESDTMSLEEQNTVMRDLDLPIAALVYSGGKSLHAIVKIDAPDKTEYRKRVDYLYSVCAKNGFEVDKQNRNPSRLSRMPGVLRNGKKQYIIDTNIGAKSFEEWREWIEAQTDDLPEAENLADIWEDIPEKSDELINGVLRKGHKMLIAGPSKAGKSFALIQLSIAIAEGAKWLGFECARGKVLYVNLELDRASCYHRFKDVYNALGLEPRNRADIDVWNLRGRSAPLDKLAPKLIRRAVKKEYAAVIIDPIYKIITGDENSADQMAHFCNQFDKICSEAKTAVIYCHHHSKGSMAGKRSMDRASGSGVFARDPDAFLDLTELRVDEAVKRTEYNRFTCSRCLEWIERFKPGFREECSQDDMQSGAKMREHAQNELAAQSFSLLCKELDEGEERLNRRTAWRVEGILREFPSFEPLTFWFDYPIHIPGDPAVMNDLEIDDGMPAAWKKNFSRKQSPEERQRDKSDALMTAFTAVEENGKCTITDLAGYMGVSEKTVRRRLKDSEEFWVDSSECGIK